MVGATRTDPTTAWLPNYLLLVEIVVVINHYNPAAVSGEGCG